VPGAVVVYCVCARSCSFTTDIRLAINWPSTVLSCLSGMGFFEFRSSKERKKNCVLTVAAQIYVTTGFVEEFAASVLAAAIAVDW